MSNQDINRVIKGVLPGEPDFEFPEDEIESRIYLPEESTPEMCQEEKRERLVEREIPEKHETKETVKEEKKERLVEREETIENKLPPKQPTPPIAQKKANYFVYDLAAGKMMDIKGTDIGDVEKQLEKKVLEDTGARKYNFVILSVAKKVNFEKKIIKTD